MLLHLALAFAIVPGMTLKEFLNSLPRGGRREFAGRCGIGEAYLSQVSNGFRSPSERLAVLIERESGGKVKASVVRPDVDWEFIRSGHRGDAGGVDALRVGEVRAEIAAFDAEGAALMLPHDSAGGQGT